MRAISEPEFYGDLVYKFKKPIGRNVFLMIFFLFRKIIIRYKHIGYVMRQSACLVFNPIMVDNYDFKLFTLCWLGLELFVCCLALRGSTGVFLLLRISISCLAPKDLQHQAAHCDCRTTAEAVVHNYPSYSNNFTSIAAHPDFRYTYYTLVHMFYISLHDFPYC